MQLVPDSDLSPPPAPIFVTFLNISFLFLTVLSDTPKTAITEPSKTRTLQLISTLPGQWIIDSPLRNKLPSITYIISLNGHILN